VTVATTAIEPAPLVHHFRQVLLWPLGYFLVVLIPTIALTGYSILKSKRLADFLEALADERLEARRKLGVLADVWRRRHSRR
jgi:hypothetical protein